MCFILEYFIQEIHVGQKHSPAAVAFQSQVIQNRLGDFALGDPPRELFP
jgi:ribosomal protein S19